MELNGKVIVWLIWLVHAVCSGTFLGLAVTTGNNINNLNWNTWNEFRDPYKNALMASIIIGFIVVCFYLIFSPIIMLGRHFGSDLHLSFGVVLGTGFHSAWVLLLSGLILNAFSIMFEKYITPAWSTTQLSAYKSTYAFAYILVGTYIVLTIALFWFRNSLYKDGKEKTYEPSSVATPAAAAAPPASPSWPPAAPQPATLPKPASSSFNNPSFGGNQMGGSKTGAW